jgi:hypothetical protein
VITINYPIRDSYGRIIKKQDSFMFIDAIMNDNSYNLTLVTVSGDKSINVSPESIVAIDGMRPDRFIDVFNINVDGTLKPVNKKRGKHSKKN